MSKGPVWRYTVILLEPDYLADTFGDTTCEHVTAHDAEGAVQEARRIVVNRYSGRGDDGEVPGDDFRVVAVFIGHIDDINPE